MLKNKLKKKRVRAVFGIGLDNQIPCTKTDIFPFICFLLFFTLLRNIFMNLLLKKCCVLCSKIRVKRECNRGAIEVQPKCNRRATGRFFNDFKLSQVDSQKSRNPLLHKGLEHFEIKKEQVGKPAFFI